MAVLMVAIPWKTMTLMTLPLPSPSTTTTSSSRSSRQRQFFSPLNCTPPLQEKDDQVVELGILCEQCTGKGWLLCDFCGGQKTNVKALNNRIYRRCPSCRAIGYVLCQNCKVFKCVTFPNYSDSDIPSL